MGIFPNVDIAELLLRLPPLLWALSFHEFCHGWTAYKLGDRTAAYQGRLSLNPLHHLDPVGTIMLIFFRFGWAKPVPINSRYFKNPRRDIAIVSFAGPAGNFISALATGVIYRIIYATAPALLTNFAVKTLLLNMLFINIGLGVFNLIPIPPLDGSKLLSVMLPASQLDKYFYLERYGMFIILILVFTGIIQAFMSPIMIFMVNICLLTFLF
jgi:Zn-dependent protease